MNELRKDFRKGENYGLWPHFAQSHLHTFIRDFIVLETPILFSEVELCCYVTETDIGQPKCVYGCISGNLSYFFLVSFSQQ